MNQWGPGEQASGRTFEVPMTAAAPVAPAAPAQEMPPAGQRPKLAKWGAAAAAGVLVVAGVSIAVASRGSGKPASATALAATATTTTVPGGKGGPPAFPGKPDGPGRRAFGVIGGGGTIASISSSGFTVTTPKGPTVTYTTSSSTMYREGAVTVGRSALAVGEHVVVGVARPAASASSTAPRAAQLVDLLLPEVVGKVVSVSGSTVVLQDSQGFWRTVQVSASTAYQSDGKTSSASALKAGVYVAASGTIASDHTTLDASAVAILGTTPASGAGPLGPGFSFGFFGGAGKQGAFFGGGANFAGGGGPGGQGGPGGPATGVSSGAQQSSGGGTTT
jgi:hypothetical protein